MQPAAKGGETTLAISRKMLQCLGQNIIQLFKNNKLTYVRYYNEQNGSHWKNAFGCQDASSLLKLLEKHNLHYEWDASKESLTTYITKEGILCHPRTGEDVWFNQAHLFNPNFRAVTLTHEKQQDTTVPMRNIYFENGSSIDKKILSRITKAYNKLKLVAPWNKGDLLILDNLLISHGRNPFQGDRKILVRWESSF